jgi:hypothetical protein
VTTPRGHQVMRWLACVLASCGVSMAMSTGCTNYASGNPDQAQNLVRTAIEVRTRVARVSSDFNFKIRLRCVPADAPFPCFGATHVESVRLPVYGTGYPMTSPFRRYKVVQGRQRLLTFHLRIGQSILKERGKLWVRVYASNKRGGRFAQSPVLLRSTPSWRELRIRSTDSLPRPDLRPLLHALRRRAQPVWSRRGRAAWRFRPASSSFLSPMRRMWRR